MKWFNEPARWSDDDGVLTVTADGRTDFWRTTGYGFVRDNGHLYGEVLAGDFDLSMRVRGNYGEQYDQAGAMVRVDEQTWLKTGVEYVDGRMHFSSVITSGQSNWAIADLPESTQELGLAITRRGDAVEVRYAVDGGDYTLSAVVYIPPGVDVHAGAMCAAPEGDGFEVTFRDFTIRGL
jgi:uncharacterized protein